MTDRPRHRVNVDAKHGDDLVEGGGVSSATSPPPHVHRAAREAIMLIDEINEYGEDRRLNGIDQALHGKLCKIRATLEIAFALERQA